MRALGPVIYFPVIIISRSDTRTISMGIIQLYIIQAGIPQVLQLCFDCVCWFVLVPTKGWGGAITHKLFGTRSVGLQNPLDPAVDLLPLGGTVGTAVESVEDRSLKLFN